MTLSRPDAPPTPGQAGPRRAAPGRARPKSNRCRNPVLHRRTGKGGKARGGSVLRAAGNYGAAAAAAAAKAGERGSPERPSAFGSSSSTVHDSPACRPSTRTICLPGCGPAWTCGTRMCVTMGGPRRGGGAGQGATAVAPRGAVEPTDGEGRGGGKAAGVGQPGRQTGWPDEVWRGGGVQIGPAACWYLPSVRRPYGGACGRARWQGMRGQAWGRR